jgi:hypothetical protein
MAKYMRKYAQEYALNYKGKVRYLIIGPPPRTGVCNWCRAVKGQINALTGKFCRLTHMAHISYYHDDDPLKDTIELCESCHHRYDAQFRKKTE